MQLYGRLIGVMFMCVVFAFIVIIVMAGINIIIIKIMHYVCYY